jgi:hypothetical protein
VASGGDPWRNALGRHGADCRSRRRMATSGEAFRLNRTQEVAGSSPASSTTERPANPAFPRLTRERNRPKPGRGQSLVKSTRKIDERELCVGRDLRRRSACLPSRCAPPSRCGKRPEMVARETAGPLARSWSRPLHSRAGRADWASARRSCESRATRASRPPCAYAPEAGIAFPAAVALMAEGGPGAAARGFVLLVVVVAVQGFAYAHARSVAAAARARRRGAPGVSRASFGSVYVNPVQVTYVRSA